MTAPPPPAGPHPITGDHAGHMAEMTVHVVFDGPPGPEAGRFVECETPDGCSINAGEWHERPYGLWELRIDRAGQEEPRRG